MIINPVFTNIPKYNKNSKRSDNSQPSFGCKKISVPQARLDEITGAFENAFKINNQQPVSDFLKGINLSKVLKPETGVMPKYNQKILPHLHWQPVMKPEDALAWNFNSLYRKEFYHGTFQDSVEKIKKDGFDPGKSAELQYGGGIYVTPIYSEAKSWSDNSVLNLRINVANPLIIDDSNLIEVHKFTNKFHMATEKFSKDNGYSSEEKGALFNEEMRKFFTRHGFDMLLNKVYNHNIILNPKDIVIVQAH